MMGMVMMAMMMALTILRIIVMIIITYVGVAPCLFLQIAQLKAASTMAPPITRRTAPGNRT